MLADGKVDANSATREAALANATATAAAAVVGVGNDAEEARGGASDGVSNGASSAITGTAATTVGDGDGATIEAQHGTAGTAPTAASANTRVARSRQAP